MQNVRMTAYQLDDLGDWQKRIVDAVHGHGAHATRNGSNCSVWLPDHVSLVTGTNLTYADGIRVVRQRIGRGLGALGIIPHRMYFEGGSCTPSPEPEMRLLGARRVDRPSPSARLAMCLKWAEYLSKCVPGFHAEPLAVSRVRLGLHKTTHMVFGGGRKATAGEKTSAMIMRHGFSTVPEGLRIEIVAPATAMDRARRYRALMADAFKRCQCHGSLGLRSYETFQSKLDTEEILPQGSVIVLAVTGKKGTPLSKDAEHLIALMTKRSIPFRMFSVENSSLEWSALDQVGSILMGAGGIAYSVALPWPDPTNAPFILGVDLGHPINQRISRVVLSLLDHRGIHLESWRCEQGRDETIGPETLTRALKWAVQRAVAHGEKERPPFFVMRDGRLLQGEHFELYKRILGARMTFVEITKYNNPEMYIDGPTPAPVDAGTECLLKGSLTPFIAPVAPRLRGDLPRTFKLEIDLARDGLALGHDKIAELVVGLSYAPGLGLAPHALPGPIYWADGIAAIGETNHQFAGQPMHAA